MRYLIIVFVFISCVSFAANTRIWDGGGADNNLSTANNWSTNVAPVAGDTLVFSGSTRTTVTNNFAAGTVFAAIKLRNATADFSISGNAMTLNGGANAIVNSNVASGQRLTISANITFSTAAPSVTIAGHASNKIVLSGAVNNGGMLLSVSSTSSATENITISGILSGAGGLNSIIEWCKYLFGNSNGQCGRN